MYADEITPGNIAKPDNARKSLGIYFSLKDFGPDVLQHVGAWLPFCVIRTSNHRKLSGSVSTVCRFLFRHTFITEDSGRGGAQRRVLGRVYLKLSNRSTGMLFIWQR